MGRCRARSRSYYSRAARAPAQSEGRTRVRGEFVVTARERGCAGAGAGCEMGRFMETGSAVGDGWGNGGVEVGLRMYMRGRGVVMHVYEG